MEQPRGGEAKERLERMSRGLNLFVPNASFARLTQISSDTARVATKATTATPTSAAPARSHVGLKA